MSTTTAQQMTTIVPTAVSSNNQPVDVVSVSAVGSEDNVTLVPMTVSTQGQLDEPTVVPVMVSPSNHLVNITSVSSNNPQVGMAASLSLSVETIKNYERLTNKPKINGVELFGDKTAYELGLAYKIKYDTVEGWASNIDYVPIEGELIIYTNYSVKDGVNIPAIKVGDGLAYAVDLPFVGDDIRDAFLAHINDTVVHITADERAFWNNKVRCYLNGDTIVFTTR